MLLSPPLVDEEHALPEWGYKGAGEKSKQFANYYSQIAKELSWDYLGLAPIVSPSKTDGVHLEVVDNSKIARELIKVIGEIFK